MTQQGKVALTRLEFEPTCYNITSVQEVEKTVFIRMSLVFHTSCHGRLESIRIGKCQNRNVSESILPFLSKIRKSQNWKVSETA